MWGLINGIPYQVAWRFAERYEELRMALAFRFESRIKFLIEMLSNERPELGRRRILRSAMYLANLEDADERDRCWKLPNRIRENVKAAGLQEMNLPSMPGNWESSGMAYTKHVFLVWKAYCKDNTTTTASLGHIKRPDLLFRIHDTTLAGYMARQILFQYEKETHSGKVTIWLKLVSAYASHDTSSIGQLCLLAPSSPKAVAQQPPVSNVDPVPLSLSDLETSTASVNATKTTNKKKKNKNRMRREEHRRAGKAPSTANISGVDGGEDSNESGSGNSQDAVPSISKDVVTPPAVATDVDSDFWSDAWKTVSGCKAPRSTGQAGQPNVATAKRPTPVKPVTMKAGSAQTAITKPSAAKPISAAPTSKKSTTVKSMSPEPAPARPTPKPASEILVPERKMAKLVSGKPPSTKPIQHSSLAEAVAAKPIHTKPTPEVPPLDLVSYTPLVDVVTANTTPEATPERPKPQRTLAKIVAVRPTPEPPPLDLMSYPPPVDVAEAKTPLEIAHGMPTPQQMLAKVVAAKPGSMKSETTTCTKPMPEASPEELMSYPLIEVVTAKTMIEPAPRIPTLQRTVDEVVASRAMPEAAPEKPISDLPLAESVTVQPTSTTPPIRSVNYVLAPQQCGDDRVSPKRNCFDLTRTLWPALPIVPEMGALSPEVALDHEHVTDSPSAVRELEHTFTTIEEKRRYPPTQVPYVILPLHLAPDGFSLDRQNSRRLRIPNFLVKPGTCETSESPVRPDSVMKALHIPTFAVELSTGEEMGTSGDVKTDNGGVLRDAEPHATPETLGDEEAVAYQHDPMMSSLPSPEDSALLQGPSTLHIDSMAHVKSWLNNKYLAALADLPDAESAAAHWKPQQPVASSPDEPTELVEPQQEQTRRYGGRRPWRNARRGFLNREVIVNARISFVY